MLTLMAGMQMQMLARGYLVFELLSTTINSPVARAACIASRTADSVPGNDCCSL